MNQDQGAKDERIKVVSLDEPYGGYSAEANVKAEDYYAKEENKTGNGVEEANDKGLRGITASELSVGPEIPQVHILRDSKEPTQEKGEIGELDLRDEVDINTEIVHPKMSTEGGETLPADDKLVEKVESTQGIGSESGEIDKNELAKIEAEMARNLENLIAEQQTVKNIKDDTRNNTEYSNGEKSIRGSMPEGEAVDSKTGAKIDQFMETNNEEKSRKNIDQKKSGTNFDKLELKSRVDSIKSLIEEIKEIQGFLEEEERKIQKFKSNISILDVNSKAIGEKEQAELKGYEVALKEKNSALTERLDELRKIIQAKPGTLALLKKDSEASAIPEIKNILDSEVDTTSGVEAEVIEPEEVLSESKKNNNIKSVETVIVKENGGLIGAIRKAVLGIDNTASEEQIGEVFELFARGILGELTAKGKSHEEALSEYQAMVQALEISNGIIEVVLNEDGEMSAHIKDNASEAVISTGAADDYDRQMAA